MARATPAPIRFKEDLLPIPPSFWRSLVAVAAEVLGTLLGEWLFPDGGRRRPRR